MATTEHRLYTFNCNGIKSNYHYVSSIIRKYDYCFLSETWLLQAEEHLLDNLKNHFKVITTPAKRHLAGRPFGGNIVLVRRGIFDYINIISQDDYSTIIQVAKNNRQILIVGVYLQSYQCPESIETYQHQLSNLTGTIEKFSDTSELIVLGDFQSFPGDLYSADRVAKTNPLSNYLHTFIEEQNLTPVDITKGTGPCYTYHHLSLENKSYIDHILVSIDLVPLVTKCSVHDPAATNTSDHLPISMDLSLPHQDPTGTTSQQSTDAESCESIPNFMWKNTLFLNLYKSKIIDKLKQQQNITENNDKRLKNLFVMLKQCASEAMSEINTNRHKIRTKPWWNRELSKSRDNLHRMFNIWRDAGFPRDPNNMHYNRYLFSRKAFRNHVKREKNQATAMHYINMESIKHSSPRSFWRQVKLSNQSSTKLYTINGKTKINEITTEFRDHFNSLLNTPRIPDVSNEQSNSELYELLSKLDGNTENFYITETDVSEAIHKLNTNKSRDPFQLQAEHLLHAPKAQFLTFLTQLLNDLFADRDLPQCLSTSIIVPLSKSNKKSLNDPNNYRGISLMPIVIKLIVTIILIKCPEITDHGPAQFGFTPRSSTIHAETIIKDTIKYYNDKGSPVYICSLDAEKAFDCCSWLKLFQKLHDQNTLPKPVLRTLIQLYTKGDASVRYQSETSSPFNLSQGVRQGSVLSPHLYNFYTKDIIKGIRAMNSGTCLNKMNTSIVAFADDIILLSSTLKGLQDMVDRCVQLGKEHLIKFNDKTQFVISGKSMFMNPTITVNGATIKPKQNLIHLGFNWGLSNSGYLTLRHHKNDRINKLWATTATLVSSGIRKLHPKSIATIYQSVVVPQLLYGLEIVDMTRSELNQLDIQGRVCLKSLLGLSKFCKNYVMNVFDQMEISSIIVNRRAQLLQQLINNNLTREYTIDLFTQQDTNYSVLESLLIACQELKLDALSVVVTGIEKQSLNHGPTPRNRDQNEIDASIMLLANWHILSNRVKFRELAESEVKRAS